MQEALLAAAQQWPVTACRAPERLAHRRRVPAGASRCGERSRPQEARGGLAIAATERIRRPPTTTCSADAAVLPPLADAVSKLPDPARGGRSLDPGDRACASRPRGDGGAAHQQGEADDQRPAAPRLRDATASERAARIAAVQRVLYLVFNEGYTGQLRPSLVRVELTNEGFASPASSTPSFPMTVRSRATCPELPRCPSRRPARPDGALVPWRAGPPPVDAAAIAEGVGSSPMPWPARPSVRTSCRPPSPRCTTRQRTAADTDWRQIPALYELLDQVATRTRGHAQPYRRGRDGERPARRPRPPCRRRVRSGPQRHHRVDRGSCPPARDGGRLRPRAPQYLLAARRTLSVPSSAPRVPRDEARPERALGR